MPIIGLSAKKQGGKTTATQMIIDNLPQGNVHQFMFSEELKNIVLRCFIPFEWGWALKDLDPDENKNKITPCGKTVRELLQVIGTDMFRGLWENVWVNATINKIKQVLADDPSAVVLITDVRFPNELKAIQDMGGFVMRLTRAPFADADQHSSETALDDIHQDTWSFYHDLANTPQPMILFDYFVENEEDGLKAMEKQIQSILILEDIL